MRDPQAKNRDHAQALRQQGIAAVELDIGSDASVDHAVKQVLAGAGRIDVLVNNAGIASAELRRRSRLTKPSGIQHQRRRIASYQPGHTANNAGAR